MFAGSTFKEQRDASRARIEFGEIVQILDNSPAIHLFRIAQEALNNAIKHGHAKTVVIALESSDGVISLRVSDDAHWIRSNPVRIERDGIKYYAQSRANDRRSIGGPAELSLGHDSCLHY
jgi:nitrate/nitrite-specific signal transduction histidine kinase